MEIAPVASAPLTISSKPRCTVCGKLISPKSTSGLCRPHFVARINGDQAIRAKAVVSIRKWMADPANRPALVIRNRGIGQMKRANPELRARTAERMRAIVQPLSCTPDAVARRDYVQRGRKISEAKLAWCPPHLRDEYRQLARRHGAAQAKVTILAGLSPFERQDLALRNGARLIANVRVSR